MGRLGAILGAPLGRSWGRLGPFGSYLEASRAHRKRKGDKAKNIGFPMFLKDFGLSRASLEGSLTTWGRLGAVPEPLGGML